MIKYRKVALATSTSLLLALGGCHTPVSVKDVAADETGYLHKNFSSQSLPDSIRSKIPGDTAAAASFREIKVTTDRSTEMPDGKKEADIVTFDIFPAPGGLLEQRTEYSVNNIPYALLLSLSYKGLLNMKIQSVNLRATVAPNVVEIKDISRFDGFGSGSGQVVYADYTVGASGQLANFAPNTKHCNTEQVRSASQVFAGLSGQATDISCENSTNNAVQVRDKYIYLNDYGVSVLSEFVTSAKKETYKISNISVTR